MLWTYFGFDILYKFHNFFIVLLELSFHVAVDKNFGPVKRETTMTVADLTPSRVHGIRIRLRVPMQRSGPA